MGSLPWKTAKTPWWPFCFLWWRTPSWLRWRSPWFSRKRFPWTPWWRSLRPWIPRRSPWSIWTTWWRPLGLPGPPDWGTPWFPFEGPPVYLALQEVVLQVPLVPWDLKAHWQSGSTLDQSILDRNQSVIQLLTAQQRANVQLQLQMQQNQAVQIAHTNALKSLAESTQKRILIIYLQV